MGVALAGATICSRWGPSGPRSVLAPRRRHGGPTLRTTTTPLHTFSEWRGKSICRLGRRNAGSSSTGGCVGQCRRGAAERGRKRVGRWFGQWERTSGSRASRARPSARMCTAWKPQTGVAACACPVLLCSSCVWLASFRMALVGSIADPLDEKRFVIGLFCVCDYCRVVGCARAITAPR